LKKFAESSHEKFVRCGISIWLHEPFANQTSNTKHHPKMNLSIKSSLSALTAILLSANSFGQINYVESISGDLGVPATPTNLGSAALGLNTVSGRLNNTAGFDPDAFVFTIDAGMQLDMLSFTSMSGTGNHFFAFNDGPLNTGSGAGNRISTLIGTAGIGTNILGGTLNSFGGSGLSGAPLGPGNYRVWFQETAGTDHNYSISFRAIPEPSAVVMLSTVGLALLAGRRRKMAL
jgi:hypothetical protein